MGYLYAKYLMFIVYTPSITFMASNTGQTCVMLLPSIVFAPINVTVCLRTIRKSVA